jgi:hypothetical protein
MPNDIHKGPSLNNLLKRKYNQITINKVLLWATIVTITCNEVFPLRVEYVR